MKKEEIGGLQRAIWAIQSAKHELEKLYSYGDLIASLNVIEDSIEDILFDGEIE